MKITGIFAHRIELSLVEGSYKRSGGMSVSVFDRIMVGVQTISQTPLAEMAANVAEYQAQAYTRFQWRAMLVPRGAIMATSKTRIPTEGSR